MPRSEPFRGLVLRVVFYLAILIVIFIIASLQLSERPGFVYPGF